LSNISSTKGFQVNSIFLSLVDLIQEPTQTPPGDQMTMSLRIICGFVGMTVLGIGFFFAKRIENTYLMFACCCACGFVYLLGIGLAFRRPNRSESKHQISEP
jgi:hypothetical protein